MCKCISQESERDNTTWWVCCSVPESEYFVATLAITSPGTIKWNAGGKSTRDWCREVTIPFMNRNIFSNMKDDRTVTIREKTEARVLTPGRHLAPHSWWSGIGGGGGGAWMYYDVGEKAYREEFPGRGCSAGSYSSGGTLAYMEYRAACPARGCSAGSYSSGRILAFRENWAACPGRGCSAGSSAMAAGV